MVAAREWRVRALWSVADGLIAVLATLTAAWMRYDMSIQQATRWGIWKYAITLGVCLGAVSYLGIVYSRSHRRGTFEETSQLVRSALIAGAIAAVVVFNPFRPYYAIPRSLPFLAPLTALLGSFALRFVIRSWRWGQRRAAGESDRATIIFGAGEGGRQLIQTLVRDQVSPNRLAPVAILDDDPLKKHWRIEGCRCAAGWPSSRRWWRPRGRACLGCPLDPELPTQWGFVWEMDSSSVIQHGS